MNLSIGRGVAVLPASRRHERHLNRRLPGKAEGYTPVYDWWSPPLVRLAEQVLTSARTRRIGLH